MTRVDDDSTVVSAVRSPVLWDTFERRVIDRIDRSGAVDVCDIGGGRNPMLTEAQVAERNLRYTVLDISQHELDLAPAGFDTLCADVAGADFDVDGRFDLMFSKFVAEHVASGELLHRNVFRALKPGGIAIHYFPTLYCLPFVVNRIVPETLGSRILDVVAPRDRAVEEKFPAKYSWTRGPTGRQIGRLESLGYEIVQYTAGFGHDYYRRIPVVRSVSERWFELAKQREWYAASCFSIVVLRKPLH